MFDLEGVRDVKPDRSVVLKRKNELTADLWELLDPDSDFGFVGICPRCYRLSHKAIDHQIVFEHQSWFDASIGIWYCNNFNCS